ncbi:unnamed protein product [Rotaria sordida]|uniref:Uncharacterized protein n=2 Tax=Rotaria sordida TaxID=392033 RepID=A0A819BW35_9BILA|nr:unnamed protein product [Rotaria sordida]
MATHNFVAKNQKTNIIVITEDDETFQNLLSIIEKSDNSGELADITRHVITESIEDKTKPSYKHRKSDLTCVNSTIDHLHITQLSPVQQTISPIQYLFLTPDGYNRINSVKLSYETAFQPLTIEHDISVLDCVIDRRSALLYATSIYYNIGMKLITFIRNIPEFELLHEQDRFILVKYNSPLNGMPNPDHVVKPMTTEQFAPFNVEPPPSASRSVNVDIDTVREVKTAKSIGPLAKVTLGVLVVCGLAAAIAVPIGLTQRAIAETATPTTIITTTTTPPPIVAITRTGDPIIGVYNTTAGGSIGGVNAFYAGPSEYPTYAIDNSTSTKYLNFGVNTGGITVYQPGINTGFYVSPVSSTASIAIGLLFGTANDVPDRDPITVTLEGTNVTSLAALYLGSSWTLIYSGPTGISATTDPGRQVYVSQQNFSNTLVFRSYRLLVTSQRGNTNCVQYSEAQIIGYL